MLKKFLKAKQGNCPQIMAMRIALVLAIVVVMILLFI